MMDVKERLQKLMYERNWTEYRLAVESDLSQSTVANIFNRNASPSLTTLEAICQGFGITMAQFFADGDLIELTREQKDMFDAWVTLSASQKQVLMDLIKVMKE